MSHRVIPTLTVTVLVLFVLAPLYALTDLLSGSSLPGVQTTARVILMIYFLGTITFVPALGIGVSASEKHREEWWWAPYAFTTWPVALIHVALLPVPKRSTWVLTNLSRYCTYCCADNRDNQTTQCVSCSKIHSSDFGEVCGMECCGGRILFSGIHCSACRWDQCGWLTTRREKAARRLSEC